MNPKTRKTLHSSEAMDWETPQDFFDLLDAEFHFNIDAAATAKNTKCAYYIGEELDALRIAWRMPGESPIVWLNPPYGRELLPKFVDKAIEEAKKGTTVVMLVPSRTDTKWFQRAWNVASEVRFIHG